MVHDMMTDPEESQADKGDDVACELGQQSNQRRRNLDIGRVGRQIWDVKLEDKKGHDNSKYAIAERLNSVFTDFKAHRIQAHEISPSLILPDAMPRRRIRDSSVFLRRRRREENLAAADPPDSPDRLTYPRDDSSRCHNSNKSSRSFVSPCRPPVSCPEQYCRARSARLSPSKPIRSKTCRRAQQRLRRAACRIPRRPCLRCRN